jgi:hypothetical protein
VVAGYEGGGAEGSDEGNRKFCASFRMPAPPFSSAGPRFLTIILLESGAAKVHSISDTINRTRIISFLVIIPSLLIISLQGYESNSQSFLQLPVPAHPPQPAEIPPICKKRE